jgi:hypothetical protein
MESLRAAEESYGYYSTSCVRRSWAKFGEEAEK